MIIHREFAHRELGMEDSSMGNMLGKAFLFLATATSVCAPVSAGEPVTYRGTGSYVVTRAGTAPTAVSR